MQTCTRCRIQKPFDAFYRASDKKSGYAAHCIACIKETLRLKQLGTWKNPRLDTIEDRFHKHVPASLPPDVCWDWQGKYDPRGYGRIFIRDTQIAAHRVAYQIAYGPIPDGLCVCHRCNRPACVNHHHLYLATAGENTHDAWADGLMLHVTCPPAARPRGERHYKAKLTEADVRLIRAMDSSISNADIAKRFGVTQENVCLIRLRKIWKHL
jgi:hypothetical protein